VNEGLDYLLKQEPDPVSITLNDYVKAYYGKNILKFDPKYEETITEISEKVVELNPRIPYDGRINEYGNHLENTVVAAINEVCVDVKDLGAMTLGTGYPDIRFKYDNKWFYVEVKIGGPDLWVKPSSFRMFYTSTPKPKVKERKDIKDGYHLLFHFEHNGPGKLTGRYRITDLCEFEYQAHGRKQEGSSKDLYGNGKNPVIERQRFATR